jgi:hypothetical protein
MASFWDIYSDASELGHLCRRPWQLARVSGVD